MAPKKIPKNQKKKKKPKVSSFPPPKKIVSLKKYVWKKIEEKPYKKK